MSEITVHCACSSPSCTVTMHVEWFRDHIAVAVRDDAGYVDLAHFTYAAYIDYLEGLDSYPLTDDKTDIYYYDFATPLLGAWGGTTTLHLYDTNRDTLITRTREMAHVYSQAI